MVKKAYEFEPGADHQEKNGVERVDYRQNIPGDNLALICTEHIRKGWYCCRSGSQIVGSEF